jgi:hypothetical protein
MPTSRAARASGGRAARCDHGADYDRRHCNTDLNGGNMQAEDSHDPAARHDDRKDDRQDKHRRRAEKCAPQANTNHCGNVIRPEQRMTKSADKVPARIAGMGDRSRADKHDELGRRGCLEELSHDCRPIKAAGA